VCGAAWSFDTSHSACGDAGREQESRFGCAYGIGIGIAIAFGLGTRSRLRLAPEADSTPHVLSPMGYQARPWLARYVRGFGNFVVVSTIARVAKLSEARRGSAPPAKKPTARTSAHCGC
jgi:hypothetical protein